MEKTAVLSCITIALLAIGSLLWWWLFRDDEDEDHWDGDHP